MEIWECWQSALNQGTACYYRCLLTLVSNVSKHGSPVEDLQDNSFVELSCRSERQHLCTTFTADPHAVCLHLVNTVAETMVRSNENRGGRGNCSR